MAEGPGFLVTLSCLVEIGMSKMKDGSIGLAPDSVETAMELRVYEGVYLPHS